MGNLSSCCRHGTHDDEESLLRGRPNGILNTNETYDAIQQQMLEQQKKIQQRESELRDIVFSTNDKLIDISMISNSGIVIQSGDFYSEDNDDEDENTMNIEHDSDAETNNEDNNELNNNNNNNTDRNEESGHFKNKNKTNIESTLTIVNDKKIPPELQQQIRQLHKNILQDINEQITIKAPQKLTMEF